MRGKQIIITFKQEGGKEKEMKTTGKEQHCSHEKKNYANQEGRQSYRKRKQVNNTKNQIKLCTNRDKKKRNRERNRIKED